MSAIMDTIVNTIPETCEGGTKLEEKKRKQCKIEEKGDSEDGKLEEYVELDAVVRKAKRSKVVCWKGKDLPPTAKVLKMPPSVVDTAKKKFKGCSKKWEAAKTEEWMGSYAVDCHLDLALTGRHPNIAVRCNDDGSIDVAKYMLVKKEGEVDEVEHV